MKSFCKFLHSSIIWIIVYQLLFGLSVQSYAQVASVSNDPAASFDEYIEKAEEAKKSGENIIDTFKKEANDKYNEANDKFKEASEKFKACLERDPTNQFSDVCCNMLKDADKIKACRTAVSGLNLYQSCTMGLREGDAARCCNEANTVEANMCRSIIKDIRQCKHEIESYREGATFSSEASSSGACCSGAKLFLTGTKILSSDHDFIKNVKCPSLDIGRIATDKLNLILDSDLPPSDDWQIVGKASRMSIDTLFFLYDYYKLEMEERHLCALKSQPDLITTYERAGKLYLLAAAGSWVFFFFWMAGVFYSHFKTLGHNHKIPVLGNLGGILGSEKTKDQNTIENADITSEQSRKDIQDLVLELLQEILLGFKIKEGISTAGFAISSIVYFMAFIRALLVAKATPVGEASPFISKCEFDEDPFAISSSDGLITQAGKYFGQFARATGNTLFRFISKFFRYFWMVLKVVQTIFFGASMFAVTEKNKGVTIKQFLVITAAEVAVSILAAVAKLIATLTGGKQRTWKAENKTLGDTLFSKNFFPVLLFLMGTSNVLLSVSSHASMLKISENLKTVTNLRTQLRGMTTPQQICWALGVENQHMDACAEHAKIIPCIIQNGSVEDQFKCCTQTIDSNFTKGSCLGITMGVKSIICAVGVKVSGNDISECCSNFKGDGDLRPLCQAVTKSSEICKGTDSVLDCCEKESAKFPSLRESVKKSCEVANQTSNIDKCKFALEKSGSMETGIVCCMGMAEEDKRVECFKKISENTQRPGEIPYSENCFENRSDSISKIKRCCLAKQDSATKVTCLKDLDEHIKRLFSSKYNADFFSDVRWEESVKKSRLTPNFLKNIKSYMLDQMSDVLPASQASNINENKVCITSKGDSDINCTCLAKNNCLNFDKRDIESFEKLGFSKKLQKKYEIFMKSMNKMSQGNLPIANFDFQNIFDIQKETMNELPAIMKKNENLKEMAYIIEKKLPGMLDMVVQNNKEKISEKSPKMSDILKNIGNTSSNKNIGPIFNRISQKDSIDSIKKETIDSSTKPSISPQQSIDSSNTKSINEKYIFNSISTKKEDDIWKIISKRYFFDFYSK